VAKEQTYWLTKKKKNRKNDKCPACDKNLYLDSFMTQKIGLLANDDKTVEGWMCPYCRATFDLEDNLTYIKSHGNYYGKA